MLLGASIIIALVNLLISLNVIPNDEASAGWVFVKAIWKGVFYFLPIMVAYNAAKKLKVDPWLGGAIMAILMTPQFTSLIDAKTTTCVENAALGTKSCTADIFGIPMALSDYSGNVFVPLLMAAVLALVYHGLKKIIPESVQLVFVPFFCMIIVGALTAFIIGPIGVWVGNGLGVGLAWMNTHAPFIFAIIIPLLYPFLVPLGLHWPLNALMLMNIQTLGYDFIQGPMGVWNFACFGATAGVLFIAVRDKDKDMRQTALGALAAGLLGGVSGTVPVRHPPALQAGLQAHARGLRPWWRRHCRPRLALPVRHRRRPDRAWCDHHRLRLHLAADHSGLRPDVGVRGVHRGLLPDLLLPDRSRFDYRTREQKAEVLARAAADQKAAAPAVEAKEAAPAATTATATATATKTEAPAAAAAATTVVNAPVAGHVIALDETGDPVFASRALGEGVRHPADRQRGRGPGLRRAADRRRNRPRLRHQNR